ncbi:hypothetical protein [Hyphomicrobium sp. NDB2Meth4]|uniref:hypothetical protein n=1 Tax=Hyphomicrobium sp. NDB2Meth4 TaxID=1892846 RepID=UPI0009315AE6|nr:hypothetical protein [Hyphomicrobium sp. NDB2Meth4]
MDWSKVYSYCERGADPSFWAEPLNAISNGAFIIAGLIAGWQLARAPRSDRSALEWLVAILIITIAMGGYVMNIARRASLESTLNVAALSTAAILAVIIVWERLASPARANALFERVMIMLVIGIGIGSFMFHTYATVWSIPFDTVPISLFMLSYLGYALRRFAGAPWMIVIAALISFFFAVKYAQGIPCSNELLPMTRGAGKRCFNGTLGYTPAFIALVLVGAVLLLQRHPAAKYLFAGAALFLISMTFRTIDLEVCRWIMRGGRGVGTHFLWHTFNGLLLYVLLLAAIRHGDGRRIPARALHS